MTFRIEGLNREQFSQYLGRTDDELAAMNARRVIATEDNAYPCRISLRDAKQGETLILLNYEHHAAATPYRSRHAIYINESSAETGVFVDEIPDQLARRLLAIRAYDAMGMMIDADVVEGSAARPVVERLLELEGAAYLHVHNARRGCYAARAERYDAA